MTRAHSCRSVLSSALAVMTATSLVFGQAPATIPQTPATNIAAEPQSRPSTPTTGPAAQISLNFKDVPVDSVLDYLSESAGFVVIREAPVEGRVTVVSKKPVSPDEAVAILSAVLRASGHTATLNGRVLKVSPRDKAKKSGIPVHVGADPAEIAAGDDLITQVIPIANVDAGKLRRDLTPLLPLDADVTASDSSNAIIITDSSGNIKRVAQIIAALDLREAASMDLRTFQLKFANASETAKLLLGMFKGGDGTPSANQQQMMEMQMRGGGGQPMPQAAANQSGRIPGGAVEQALHAKITAVADDRTNTLFVTAPAEALKLIEKILKDLDSNPVPTSQIKAFPLKFADAETTSKLIAKLIKEGDRQRGLEDFPFYMRQSSNSDATKGKVNVTFDERTNSVVVSAPADVIKDVENLIKTLDSNPAASAELKVFQLKYADAWETSKLVRSTFAPEDKDKSDSPFRMLIFGGGGDQGSKKGPKVTVSSDDRTNTVIVTGPTEMMKVIGDLIKQIDANPVSTETMFIYRLRNGQAAKLEFVLNTLFGNYGGGGGQQQNGQNGQNGQQQDPNQRQQNRQSGFARSGSDSSSSGSFGSNRNDSSRRDRQNSNSQQNPAGAAHASNEMSGEVFVVADRDTNSLLVTTASKYQDRVKQIIAELDRPVPQVLIKVLVAEVTHDDSADLGLDFSVINRRANGEGTSISSAFGNAGQTAGLVISTLEDKLNAQLHVLAVAGKLDILSRPSILGSDNQPASILVGNSVPLVTGTSITESGQQINQITYRDVGIILNVTPHINPDGLVIMDVTPEVSQLSGTTVQISPTATAPVIQTRSADSRVGVRSGQTIVIAGLMQDTKTSTISKLPILGDIPILGWVFSRVQVSKSKTELLFFITPHVVQQPEALQGTTAQEQQGLQLMPRAVSPGTFEQHLQGLDRGNTPFTQPTTPDDAVRPIGPATVPASTSGRRD